MPLVTIELADTVDHDTRFAYAEAINAGLVEGLGMDAEDRFHTFNMGIGWVAIVDEKDVEASLTAGKGGVVIGRMVPQEGVRVRVSGE